MRLTKADKLILESYSSMLDGLSAYLGSPYEISLHSLEDYHHSVIKICNGYHSGRSVGAPITDLALNMLKRVSDNDYSAIGEYTSYSVINDSGERLKSSTIPVFGENHRLIGLICINLYLDLPASEFMQSFLSSDSKELQEERFNSNLTDSIAVVVSEVKIKSCTTVQFIPPIRTKKLSIFSTIKGSLILRILSCKSRKFWVFPETPFICI